MGRGRERKRTLGICFLKVLCLFFYSVFYDPLRINYNLPAGYFASAMTAFVMAEALYPHGRLYLILSPSLFPSLSLTQIPRKSPRKESENSPHCLPKSPQSPHPLLSLSLSFASPSGLAFPFQKKDRKPLNPSISKGLEGIREGRRRKGLLGMVGFWDVIFGGREGEGMGRGKKRTLGICVPQGPESTLLFCFL